MSLKSWEEEFYPTPASSVSDWAVAIEHSLSKWRGLRADNLKRHAVVVTDGKLHCGLGEPFRINGETCALCSLQGSDTECDGCPLYESRGQVKCDEEGESDEDSIGESLSPYYEFILGYDPEPMITALELAKGWQSKQQSEAQA